MSQGIVGTGRRGLKTKSLDRKSVLLGLVGLAVAIFAIYSMRLQPRTPKSVQQSKSQGSPGFVLANLKDSYSELTQILPERITPPRVPSELEKLQEKALIEKIKRAEEARRSKLSFDSVTLTESKLSLPSPSSSTAEDSEEKLSPRDEVNRQDEKLSFLKNSKEERTHVNSRLREQASKYELLAGTVIPGLLITGINSDLPGEILGQVSSNVFDTATGNYLLVPQGSRVLGRYDSRIVYGQERVLVSWKRLIFPDGSSISLETMPGVDAEGYAGLSDTVNNHYGKLFTGIIFSSLLGASAQMANGPNYQTVDPEYGQLALQGVARNMNETGQEITRKNLNIQPTLEISPGYRFNIFVNKDVTLREIR